MIDYSHLINEIKREIPTLELREAEPMCEHCSFKIGGNAAAMAFPSSAEETAELCLMLKRVGIKPLIIGNGTNLLVTDRPLERFVIKMSDKMSAIENRGEQEVFALCGVSLARLALHCAHRGLTGMEFAHGIPGSLGGAVCMNAGAYGGEMKDILKSVTYLNEDAEIKIMQAAELDLGYRHSAFSETERVVLGAELFLKKRDEETILARMRELSEKRRASQPLDKPSAGSTFKRPVGAYAAALIDECGLRGYSIGGAQVSKKHAGFVINKGGATYADVLALIEHIKETVFKEKGIELCPEVKIIDNN